MSLHLDELGAWQLLQDSSPPLLLECPSRLLLLTIAYSSPLLNRRPSLPVPQHALLVGRVQAAREVIGSNQQADTMTAGAAVVGWSHCNELLEASQIVAPRLVRQLQQFMQSAPHRQLFFSVHVLCTRESVQVSERDELLRVRCIGSH